MEAEVRKAGAGSGAAAVAGTAPWRSRRGRVPAALAMLQSRQPQNLRGTRLIGNTYVGS